MFVIDQAIKFGVSQTMALYESIPIALGFNWVHVLNPGAAFSFLADAGGWQRHVLSIVALAVSSVLAALLWRGVASWREAAAYALIIGGAMGNAADRLRIGAVVDYLDLYWRTWHWPAFNLADICISIAAFLLIWSAWRDRPVPPKNEARRAT